MDKLNEKTTKMEDTIQKFISTYMESCFFFFKKPNKFI